MGPPKLQVVFFGLIDRSHRVINTWCPRVLDVGTSNGPPGGPSRTQPGGQCFPRKRRYRGRRAGRDRRCRREEDAGEPIEHCDAGGLMPRNRKDIELAAPEVVDTTVLRPADAKERPDRRRIATDNRRARPTDKLTVTCDVIAVGVAVRDNKRDGGAPVPEEPCADESVDRGVATSTRPAPVSSSKARSWPKTRYRNGFSKLVHAAWRRMKKPSLYACTRNGGVPLQAAPRRTSSPEADRAAAWKAGGWGRTQAPGLCGRVPNAPHGDLSTWHERSQRTYGRGGGAAYFGQARAIYPRRGER